MMDKSNLKHTKKEECVTKKKTTTPDPDRNAGVSHMQNYEPRIQEETRM